MLYCRLSIFIVALGLCLSQRAVSKPPGIAPSGVEHVKMIVYVYDHDHPKSKIVFAGEESSVAAYHAYEVEQVPGSDRPDTWVDHFDMPMAATKWSVDGIPGGNADVGTIAQTSKGLATYKAPQHGIGIVTISAEYIWPDGRKEHPSYTIYTVDKRWRYRASAGLGYKCLAGMMSADVHSIGEMEVTFHLKRDNDLDHCISEVESGPTVTKTDTAGNGSCDPHVETTLKFGRPMEVSDFNCTYTGSDHKMKFNVALHYPDCPGYKNVLLATGKTIVEMPVKESDETTLVPEVQAKPHILIKSPPMNSPGMNLRTAWELTALN